MTENDGHDLRDSCADWLSEEVAAWQDDGLVSSDLAQAILSRYGPTPGSAKYHTGHARFVAAISALGAVLIGTGAVLFFAANWGAVSQPVKVALVIGALLGTHAAGFVLRFIPGRYPRVGDSMILLGTLVYGAGVFLIEQVYNLNASDPMGLLLVALGTLPLAYAIRSRAILTLGLLASLVWMGWQILEVSWKTTPAVWLILFYAAGLTLMAAGRHHRRWSSFSAFDGIYFGLGLAIFLTAFLVLTFPIVWQWSISEPLLAGRSWWSSVDLGTIGWALVGLAFVLIVKIPLRIPASPRGARAEALLMLAALLPVGFVLLKPPSATVSSVVFNVAYFLLLLGLIKIGYSRADGALVTLGLVFAALGILGRYFDLFWDLLSRSAFFMAGGLALLVGSLLLERARRRLLADTRSAEEG